LVTKNNDEDLNSCRGDRRKRRPQSNPNQYSEAAHYIAGKRACRVYKIARPMRYGG